MCTHKVRALWVTDTGFVLTRPKARTLLIAPIGELTIVHVNKRNAEHVWSVFEGASLGVLNEEALWVKVLNDGYGSLDDGVCQSNVGYLIGPRAIEAREFSTRRRRPHGLKVTRGEDSVIPLKDVCPNGGLMGCVEV